MARVFKIFTDGACSGNPGPAAIGFIIREGREAIVEFSQEIGPATNNIAEYMAVIYALQEALLLKADEVEVNTDSELLFNQATGQYKVKNANIKLLCDQIKHLSRGFRKLTFRHIPREQNTEADYLASSAIPTKVGMARFRPA